MTNKEAFMVYYPDGSRAELVLGIKEIDPALSDKNAVSAAWGMIESCTNPDYSQGRTSEKMSGAACRLRLNEAKKILKDNGINWNNGSIPKVGRTLW